MFLETPKDDVLWTLKVYRNLDESVQKALILLGYKSKAELAREAVREFIIRRKLFSLLGGEPTIPVTPKLSPQEAVDGLIALLGKIPPAELDKEIRAARKEVARELLGDTE
jgi:hypothetical protein